jgi:1-acyl-sn-glycerol-3-phosphate acyltransferase
VLFGALPRRVSFLVKAEMFKGFVGWVLTNVGQYGLQREVPDRAPLLNALAQLKAGGSIGIFPEGTRGSGAVQNVFNGAGWLACRSGAQIVPIAMRGTLRPAGTKRRLRPRVDVLIGPPFSVPVGAGRTAVAAATDKIRGTLKELVAELDRHRWASGNKQRNIRA